MRWSGPRGAPAPPGANAGAFEPLSLKEIAAESGSTGGPIAGHEECNAENAGQSFSSHLVDVEVDSETGRVTVLRYTVAQDAGKAVHPSYVEGQYQGGAAQGIGWALNEEYIYGEDGRLQNPGFLDYRVPVASDLPMIDTVIVEVPNPGHPYGVRGVRRDLDRAAASCRRQRHRRRRRGPCHRRANVAAARASGRWRRRARQKAERWSRSASAGR